MCSIFGIIDNKNNIKNKDILAKKLSNIMKHRGPDDSGLYKDEHVAFATNRLAIQDLNDGNQPFKFKNFVSIFNGEIYNFKEIKLELEKKGYKFKTLTDSEIILPAYDMWGIDFIKKLNGIFSIAILNKNKKQIFLVRDRCGIKPLFYYCENNTLVFSSEIEPIIKFPNFKLDFDINSLTSYLIYRYPMDNNNNFFRNIHRIEPGTYLKIKIDTLEINKITYWKIPKLNKCIIKDENEILEKLENQIVKSIKYNLISDAPLGVFLSGGVDSSLLSSITSKIMNTKIKTYSVGFEDNTYDESNDASLVSKFINSEHTNIIINKDDFINNIENMIDIKSVPLSIPHEYPLYKLAKIMKKDIKVVLSGEGVDEVFGGYARTQKCAHDYLKGRFITKIFDNKIIKNLLNVDINFNFKDKDYIDYFFNKYNWLNPSEIKHLFKENFSSNISMEKVQEPWKNIIKNYASESHYDQTLIMFQKNHLQCLLDRLDIMTMKNSIEARVPFLDHELIELAAKIPFNMKIKWNSLLSKFLSIFRNNFEFSEKIDTSKYVIRKISKNYLPNKISLKTKKGFPLPMNEWMRDKKIKEMLLDEYNLFFNKKFLEKIYYNEIRKDPYDFNGKKIWMLINLNIWAKKFIK
jgi:asparagine synthase (glutamine-hydrolysing)